MTFTILIPHYREGRLTAYAIAQLLKLKGKHFVDIVVIDNKPNDGSIKYLEPFKQYITVLNYPTDKLQSHGIAFDYALTLGFVKNDYFITMESDSFPTQDNWLEYYEKLILDYYDCAGSVLKLSGGTYLHPCGALYKKSVWEEAKKYCDIIPYSYFPNMSMKEGFQCHLMVHENIVSDLIAEPEDFIELADGYKPYSADKAIERLQYYKPVVAPFHNGMGGNEESIKTYGLRTIESESPTLFDTKKKLINRIGYEPGQWFSSYHRAMDKKVFSIPTKTLWIPEREDSQQEYTLMENGFRHIWAGSSYLDMKDGEYNDVYELKKKQIEELYNSLPAYQKNGL